jgi:hypothetical protein
VIAITLPSPPHPIAGHAAREALGATHAASAATWQTIQTNDATEARASPSRASRNMGRTFPLVPVLFLFPFCSPVKRRFGTH